MHGLPLRIHRQQVETSEGKDDQAAVDDYLINLPYLSWRMALIGDRLYLPFAPDNKTEKLLEKK